MCSSLLKWEVLADALILVIWNFFSLSGLTGFDKRCSYLGLTICCGVRINASHVIFTSTTSSFVPFKIFLLIFNIIFAFHFIVFQSPNSSNFCPFYCYHEIYNISKARFRSHFCAWCYLCRECMLRWQWYHHHILRLPRQWSSRSNDGLQLRWA